MPGVAVVTGAGSGVGQAVAIALARKGWTVAILGRRESALRESIAKAEDASARLHPYPCDIASESAVQAMAADVLKTLGPVDALINSAGTNIPDRALSRLTMKGYREILETNLTGTLLCVQAFLPVMRQRRRGTIINIVSDAGLIANAKAGPAYVASKFAVTGLTQSINAEERGNGIRACAISPGDIDTPILDKRPTPPTAEARLQMLQPEDVAACVMLQLELPDRAVIEQLVIRPR